jgi:hypothetical protein
VWKIIKEYNFTVVSLGKKCTNPRNFPYEFPMKIKGWKVCLLKWYVCFFKIFLFKNILKYFFIFNIDILIL